MAQDRMLVLAACYLTILSVGENSTAIMAALPAMTSGLGFGPATLEWIVNACLLASAVFIILGGEAADQFGARRSSAAVKVPLTTAVRTLSIRCAPLGDQRICWLALIRRCSSRCTVLSVVAVDIGSSFRRAVA